LTVGQSSASNYKGDEILFPLWVTANRIGRLKQDGTSDTELICIPPYYGLVGYNITSDGYLFRAAAPPTDKDQATLNKAQQSAPACQGVATVLNQNDLVDVASTTLANFPPNRYGFSYGVLAVPFKFELNHKHDLQASATLGPYIGYTVNFETPFALNLTMPVLFLGPTIFNTTTTSGSSSAGFGISGGAGFFATIKGAFQLGFVAGYDRTNSGSGYQFNNRWWVSAAIGYPFR
jgi:hypothetical protein